MKYTFKNVMILGLGCLLGFTSCSDSWLNTDSTQTAEGDVIFSTTDNAKLVINGICRTMVQQHAYYGQNFNGEGTMKLLYGEYPGQDFNFPYMAPGWSPLMNNQSTITQSSSSIYDSYPWYYYYLIIGNANAVINRIDKAEGSQEEKDFLKAEALTFRAYSFFRLAELYCEPWARSNDGATDGVVLRIVTVTSHEELPSIIPDSFGSIIVHTPNPLTAGSAETAIICIRVHQGEIGTRQSRMFLGHGIILTC
jgi:starch-binding outer membrane protein, SusD/RagB family